MQAFSRAVMDEKSLSPLFPVGGGSVVTNDWCMKEAAYKGLVHPVLDYGTLVWDPPGVVLQEELESVLPDS